MEIPGKLVDALSGAQHVMVLTGAGVSAESGLATFRSPQTGLWERFRPEALATPQAFERDPALVWGWYEWRRMKTLLARPNAGHVAIKALESLVPRLTLVTQNVDDLHERAGSALVLHLHGSLSRPFCESCHQAYVLPTAIPNEPEGGRLLDPPRCIGCAARIRPGVIWFGEMLPEREWQAAAHAARHCDVFICTGTSALVQPAATLVDLAIEGGAVTVQIDPNGTGLEERLSHALVGPAGVVLPALLSRLGLDCLQLPA